MRVLIAILLLSLLTDPSILCDAESSTSPDSPFDQYGTISWEDEKARLDNFAIQLQNNKKCTGYILVFDKTNGCPGEATARGIRARRYTTEYRGIPWNQVIWRREGYREDVRTTLLIAPPGVTPSFPTLDSTSPSIDGPLTRACQKRLERIRKIRW